MVCVQHGGTLPLLLLAGGNWNNGLNAGPGCQNANNRVSNSNRNIGTHLELRYRLSGPEQHTDQNSAFCGVKHTTYPRDSASIWIQPVERSIPLAGPVGVVVDS